MIHKIEKKARALVEVDCEFDRLGVFKSVSVLRKKIEQMLDVIKGVVIPVPATIQGADFDEPIVVGAREEPQRHTNGSENTRIP
jgi:hypothetical protein